MKEALEKILKNYVLRNTEFSNYDIQIFPTPEKNKKYYEVEIYIPESSSGKLANKLSERLYTALSMLGFTSAYSDIFHKENTRFLIIKGFGYFNETK